MSASLPAQCDAVVAAAAEEYSRPTPCAAAPTLAALFGTGPFSHLDSFDDTLSRETAPVQRVVEF